ncbi:MAG: hypothetical protein LJE91_09825 [Gammaproteobacteria bacterium]|nr:hypothetical protein [Gammaproteobacteria bacterium]
MVESGSFRDRRKQRGVADGDPSVVLLTPPVGVESVAAPISGSTPKKVPPMSAPQE